ncbi:hypothetical protein [Actinomadura roseirufa]|uniref:hypothetical protein n=1 Tax=Actinomadura roseirufa TaxID=2094049 RepID=UPI0010413F78|nr:hypothetical protein [Actinomadura roseirufa]
MPGRSDGWWISPVVPTIANCVLAVLWAFSTFGGWGDAAFCEAGEARDPGCAADLDHAILFSAPVAALATVAAVIAWALPSIRHNAGRLDTLLTVAAFGWVFAEGVLFIGGYLAQP